MLHWINRLYSDIRGAALIEFALVLPLMALLLFGGAEATNYIITNQKVEKAGYVLTDITTQFQQQSAPTARPGELTQAVMASDIFPQLSRLMGNDSDPSKQVVILTSLRKEGGIQKIKWQVVGGGTLTNDVTSQVNGLTPSGIGPGVKDTAANLPPEVVTALGTMAEGDNVIVGEVFLRYEPMASALFPAKTLSKSIYLHPRNDEGKLVCLPPDFVQPECVGGPAYVGTTCSPISYCNGPDFTTRDCDGAIVVGSTVECALSCPGSAPVSACEGNDYVTKNCKGVETGRLIDDTVHGCRPICDNTIVNMCTIGTPGNQNPGTCGGNATWTCTGAAGSVAPCNKPNPPCAINGGWTDWGVWGACSLGCGGGVQTRTRSCTNPPPANGGANCSGSDTDSQACNTMACPIDGGYSAWSGWSACSAACGGGTQTRTRTCTSPAPANGGNDCTVLGPDTENQSCNTHACPVRESGKCENSVFNTCQKGVANNGVDLGCGQTSEWRCLATTDGAPDMSGTDADYCSIVGAACPIGGACGASEWTCAVGTAFGWNDTGCGGAKTWYCSGAHGGANSPQCSVANAPCPVDGGWSGWDACSALCGGGTQTRSCTNPPPAHGGANCSGAASQSCNTHACPHVYTGTWSQGACPTACGYGASTIVAACSNGDCDPATKPGDLSCSATAACPMDMPCDDECGITRAHNQVWCPGGGTPARQKVKCINGNIVVHGFTGACTGFEQCQ